MVALRAAKNDQFRAVHGGKLLGKIDIDRQAADDKSVA
jgi:hypothetical protein